MMVPRVGVTVAVLVGVKDMVNIERGVAIIPWEATELPLPAALL